MLNLSFRCWLFSNKPNIRELFDEYRCTVSGTHGDAVNQEVSVSSKSHLSVPPMLQIVQCVCRHQLPSVKYNDFIFIIVVFRTVELK